MALGVLEVSSKVAATNGDCGWRTWEERASGGVVRLMKYREDSVCNAGRRRRTGS